MLSFWVLHKKSRLLKNREITLYIVPRREIKFSHPLSTVYIHTAIGKVSFGAEKLTENFNTLMEAINKARPAAAKGQYLRSVTVASTMGPGVKVNPAKIG